ncbi:hypothetical protein [Peribacillus butanolivorans]|uniref:hypothetical protein n=1 Tax=Peribacillus butanolivorans TaxID=421767 RepID=UPI00207CA2E8|nr:hypothetical protein [Peribacillus butanolivorans]MCO0597995.1 hypothetical protein [Peribacillus butanolivorans]
MGTEKSMNGLFVATELAPSVPLMPLLKRLIGYGLLKEIQKELNLGNVEEGDLVNISGKD